MTLFFQKAILMLIKLLIIGDHKVVKRSVSLAFYNLPIPIR